MPTRDVDVWKHATLLFLHEIDWRKVPCRWSCSWDFGIGMDGISQCLHYVGRIAHVVSYTCIDLFALATGFLCANSRCKYSRLATLWIAAVFWGVSMLLLCQFGLNLSVGRCCYRHALLPVLHDQYWFFSSYFMLFLAMPFLNCAIRNMGRAELRRLIVVSTAFLCVYPSFTDADPFEMRGGGSFAWLGVVYVIGAYIRKFTPRKLKPSCSFCIAGLLVCMCCLCQLLARAIGRNMPDFYFHHDSPFLLGIALFIFLGCLKLSFAEGAARFFKVVSATTFGIYLIHVQPFVWTNVWQFYLRQIRVESVHEFFLVVVSLSVTVFAVLAIVEFVRLKAFEWLGVNRLVAKVDQILPR